MNNIILNSLGSFFKLFVCYKGMTFWKYFQVASLEFRTVKTACLSVLILWTIIAVATIPVWMSHNLEVCKLKVWNRAVVSGGALAPPEFESPVNPIPTRGGRLCFPHYCEHPRIPKPNDSSVEGLVTLIVIPPVDLYWIFWKIKLEKSSSTNWIFSLQKSISKLIFASCTSSKIQLAID